MRRAVAVARPFPDDRVIGEGDLVGALGRTVAGLRSVRRHDGTQPQLLGLDEGSLVGIRGVRERVQDPGTKLRILLPFGAIVALSQPHSGSIEVGHRDVGGFQIERRHIPVAHPLLERVLERGADAQHAADREDNGARGNHCSKSLDYSARTTDEFNCLQRS